MDKNENLLALIAESLILIFANQTKMAGSFQENLPIIHNLKNRLVDIMKDRD